MFPFDRIGHPHNKLGKTVISDCQIKIVFSQLQHHTGCQMQESKTAVSCLGIRNVDPVIRICQPDEASSDLILQVVMPFVLISLILVSFSASLCLQLLGDDLELYRWFGILRPSVIKDLLVAKFYIKEANNDKYEQQELEEKLLKLIDKAGPTILNHQDRETGKTF